MKKTDLTKKAIIDSTIKILREQGNVTVKEISSDANVNIAAINYHFNDKQNLIVIVIKRLISEFKTKLEEFLNATATDTQEIHVQIRCFLDEFYNFAFENIGVIRYILSPSNGDLLGICSKIFMSHFSMDSELTHKIVEKLGELNRGLTTDELRVKYVFLFSGFAFPLIFQLNLKNLDNNAIFHIRDGNEKDIYINQLIKVIMS
jgi:Transcriptional regulator